MGTLKPTVDAVGLSPGRAVVARYVNDVPTGLSRAEAKDLITLYLSGQGFVYGDERGEGVWRKGAGTLAAPQFIKAEPAERRVHIEAWVPRFVFLPGLYAGEEPLDGWYGWAIKAALRARVTELETRLSGGRIGAAPAGASIEPARRRPKSSTTATPPSPEPQRSPGWYPDPIGKHVWRYWEGSKWTVHVADDETPRDAG
jgi:hypothetical protein